MEKTKEVINFFSYKVTKEKPIDDQVNDLKQLAAACGFGDSVELLIKGKILAEYHDPEILETLHNEENISLEQLLKLLRAREELKISSFINSYPGSHDVNSQQSGIGGDNKVEGNNLIQQKGIPKEKINDIINSSLRDCQTLTAVEHIFEISLGCSLYPDDKNYIHSKYLEQLVELWLDELSDNVMDFFDKNRLLQFIDDLNRVNSLQDCLILGLNSPYNNLLKHASQHVLLLKSKDSNYTRKFKKTILTFMFLKIACLRDEMNFLQCLTRSMKTSKNVQLLCSSLNAATLFHPEENEVFCLRNFLQAIINCSKGEDDLSLLKSAAKNIIDQENYFFIQSVKDTIKAYLKPFVLTECFKDGRKLLEVSGEHIVLSQVLPDIETKLNEIEEVRFVHAGVVHINENLSCTLWHGKNIVVSAETVIVSNDRVIIWDVSGKDAPNEETYPAGSDSEGVGIDGADGIPGESGGNILMICDELENASNLMIVSNGGKGSKGQDGGKGMDGKDGSSINEFDFKVKFPPVSKFWNSCKRLNLETTRLSVKEDIHSVQFFALGKLVSLPVDEFDNTLKDYIEELNDIYFEVKTHSGCKILFSFYYGSLFTFCQSFLLYKGADGELGKNGGGGGLGGKGGFAGEVEVQVSLKPDLTKQHLALQHCKGIDGTDGKSGEPGKPGKSGRDFAYTDSTYWGKPEYFTTHSRDNRRLKVEYYNESGPDRIYCSHNGKYADIAYLRKDIYQSCQVKYMDTRNDIFKSQSGLQIKRKKTIDTKSIIEQYGHKTSHVDSQKLIDLEKNIKCLFEANNNEDIVDQTVKDSNITRKIELFQSENYEINMQILANNTSHEAISRGLHSTKELIEWVHDSPNDIAIWTKLCQFKLTSEELETLWRVYLESSSRLEFDLSEEIGYIYKNKYHLAILNDVQQSFIEQNNSFFGFNTYPKHESSVQSCLTLSSDQESYDGIESFLCDNLVYKRLHMIRILEQNDQLLNLSVDIFGLFLEEGHIFLPEKKIIYYKKTLNCLKYNKARKMDIKLQPILNDLRTHENQQIYEQLVKAVSVGSALEKIKAEGSICKDQLRSVLYRNYSNEVKGPLLWKSKSKLKKIILNDMRQKGAFSMFYREILAHYFDTNLLLYAVDEKSHLVLKYNHNPTANEAVHLLMENQRFLKLKVDDELWKMNRLHEEKSQLCSQLQQHINLTINKAQFDPSLLNLTSLRNVESKVNESEKISLKINHIMKEDEFIELILNSFEQGEDKHLMKSRLTMLKHKYIGYQSALYYIHLHLTVEGNYLSVSELSCVVNFTLKSLLESPTIANLVSWILASFHQTNWVAEFTLMKLELCLKKLLDQNLRLKWREYLNEMNKDTLILFLEKLDNDKSLIDSLEKVDESLFLLSYIPYHHAGLPQLCLSEWKYVLKDLFWTCKIKTTGCWSGEQLELISFYLMKLENSLGMNFCLELVEMVRNHIETVNSKAEVLETLRLLTNKEILFCEELVEHLHKANINEWQKVLEDKCFYSKGERTLNQLEVLIKNSSNTSKDIVEWVSKGIEYVKRIKIFSKFLIRNIGDEDALTTWITSLLEIVNEHKISLFDTGVETCQGTKIHFEDKEFQKMLGEIKNYSDSVSCNKNETNLQDFFCRNLDEIVLATVCTSIYVHKSKIILRETQLLAILTFLKANKNILGQISTGEGKSIIIISVAIIKALSGIKVDIITSSHVLAKRDALEFEHICDLFGIKVGHNCSENKEQRKATYSNCQIVYGELAYYQRDYLLDRVYNNNILGDRSCETVLVDEVDSMLLDRGNNVLYLSHEIPGLDKLEPLFVFIWKYLNLPNNLSNHEESFSFQKLKDLVLYEIYGQIRIEHIRNLDTTLQEHHVRETWSHLIKEEVIDESGKFLHVEKSKIDQAVKTCIHGEHINYLFNKIMNRQKAFEIPNCLKKFVEDHLQEWIESAVKAISLRINRDYVVDIDRSDDSVDRNPNIIILDRDTGTDLAKSQWDQGLHQFLQLKHGCRMSPLTFKAVFISNVTYLKLYKTLIGLTGTLGSEKDRDLLKEIYRVNFVTIPTAKAKDFIEKTPVLCDTTNEWSSKVFETVYDVTSTRSALIICESLKDVFVLKKYFEVSFDTMEQKREIHTYTRDYEELTIAQNLDPGHIIISTNLAGRGTDIKLSDQLIKAGGLHVCLSYLPDNCRIEEQAFGRAARNGEPGSGQIIFRNLGHKSTAKIIDLIKERDTREVFRISKVKEYYETKINFEENCFAEFLKIYDDLKNSKHCNEIKSILLTTSLNQWALWLERNSISCGSCPVSSLVDDVSKLVNNDFGIWSQQVKDPFELTKLGLTYLKLEDNQKAITLFDQVIENEPVFSEAAYYYRACANSAETDLQKADITTINELHIVRKKLQDRVECALTDAQFIEWLKTNSERTFLQIDSYREQQESLCQTYGIFMNSIHTIIGHAVSPVSFLSVGPPPRHGTSNEVISSLIFNDLIKKKIIIQKIKNDVSEMDLKFLFDYGVCPSEVKDMLDEYPSNAGVDIQLEEYILKWCRHYLPSRELLWEELMSVGYLINEERYVLINHERLKEIDPSLAKQIVTNFVDTNPPRKDQVSLFSPEELGQLEQSGYFSFNENVLIEKLGYKKYQFLKQNQLVKLSKLATISYPLVTTELNYFDCITIEDFNKIGITTETAACILNDLICQKVICCKDKNGSQYSLLLKYEDIDKIELETHPVYTNDTRKLLSHCFAFRIALQKMECAFKNSNGNNISVVFPLQINLERRLWWELTENGIIETIVNNKMNSHAKLKNLYCESMSRNECAEIFAELYDKSQSDEIVDALIKSEWLKTTWEPNKYIINYKVENSGKTELLNKPKDLQPALKNDIETIEAILSNRLYLIFNFKSIEDRIKHLAGSIYFVETPKLSLTSLETVLTKSRIPTSEVNKFSVNGMDEVVYLEEKKYTRKMKRNVFIVGFVALSQIAVGALLGMTGIGSVLGTVVIIEGINDLIFGASCFFNGHFSWESYMGNKVISILFTAASSLKYASNVGESYFGTKVGGFSVETLKEKSYSLFSKAKNTFWSVFQFNSTKPVSRGEIVSQLCKRVLLHTAESTIYGLTCASIDYIVECKMEDLSNVLAGLINSDIDRAILDHKVFESAIELYSKLDETKSLNMVESCVLDVVKKHHVRIDKSFESIDLDLIKTLIERTTSKGFTKQSLCESTLEQTAVTAVNVITAVQKTWSHIQFMSMLVHDILNEINEKLQDELRNVESAQCETAQCESVSKFRDELKNTSIIQSKLDDFKCNLLDMLQNSIKNVLSEHITDKVLLPIINFTESCLLKYCFSISRKANFFIRDEDLKLPLNQRNHSQQRGAVQPVVDMRNDLVHSNFYKILLELLKRRQNKPLMAYILKHNTPIDKQCLELCFKTISLVLKEEGVEVPPFTLDLKISGSKHRISFGCTGNEAPVVSFYTDEDFGSNLKNNQVFIRDVFQFLSKLILNNHPEYKGFTAEVLQNMVIKAFDYYCDSHSLRNSVGMESETYEETWTKKGYQINTVFEVKIPYQHSHCEGGWKFSPHVDVDLRETKKLINLSSIPYLVEKGFETALEKINNHLHMIQDSRFKFFNLELQDFTACKHELSPPLPSDTSEIFHCYTSQYELVVPLMLKGCDSLVEFSILMSLNTEHSKNKPQSYSPNGPHILYELNPLRNAKFLNRGLKGHILLNIECTKTLYNLKDCHVAGELIAASVLPQQQNQRTTENLELRCEAENEIGARLKNIFPIKKLTRKRKPKKKKETQRM